MPVRSNLYTVLFVGITAVIFSCALALAATLLQDKQQANVNLEIKRNILKSLGALTDEHPLRQAIEDTFAAQVEAIVVDAAGEVVTGAEANKIKPEDEAKKPEGDRRFPVFILKDAGGQPIAYCIPVEGKGLWSTLYGYLSLEADLDTVRGITFYKHGETPGLGAEIETAWFQDQFKGKRIMQDGKLVSVTVVKGKASDRYSGEQLAHYVDGISGATLTSNGVTKLLLEDLAKYKAYFDRLRGKGAVNHG